MVEYELGNEGTLLSSPAKRLSFSYRAILSVICRCIHTHELDILVAEVAIGGLGAPRREVRLDRERRCGAVRPEDRAHWAGKEARPASGAPGSASSALEPGRGAPVGRWRRPGADLERRRVCALPPARARLPPPRVRRRRSARTSSIRPDRPPAPRPSIKPGQRVHGGGSQGLPEARCSELTPPDGRQNSPLQKSTYTSLGSGNLSRACGTSPRHLDPAASTLVQSCPTYDKWNRLSRAVNKTLTH